MKTACIIAAASAAALTACTNAPKPTDVIYASDAFTVYTDRVEQGAFTATATSPTSIVTNYKSPQQSGISRLMHFRLSINSRDNELPLGQSHHVLIGSDSVFTFGQAIAEFDTLKADAAKTLDKDTRWTLKVNMQPVLDSFKSKGYYVTPTNDTIYKHDFKGVWVAGSVDPLSWDFENLYGKHDRKLKDRGDGVYEVTLNLNPTTDRPDDPTGWSTDTTDTRFPTYSSDQVLVDALYNMGIADIAGNLRDDSTYRAGKEWDGVWTRDVAYSIYLSLAYLDPANSLRSLRAKLKNAGTPQVSIIQDTGTGGSWPVSSDRIVWALAAWEIYKVTGDKAMLAEAAEAIANSLRQDMMAVWDRDFKLMHGEQSYLDWREQTYPKWMQPIDIYESMCLGTNVLFAHAIKVLGLMQAELGAADINAPWHGLDEEIINSINNNLWIPNMGYYSEYLYGGVYPIQSPAVDNLGQALAVLLDVANPEMARSIVSKTPYTPYGISSVYPQQPDINPYHNDAVWPFVQAYWNLAAAKTGNIQALSKGLGSIFRAAALFGTNKELFVASNGDYRGTAVNSDSQLWSCTGIVAMITRVIMGMQFHTDGITFAPVVPPAFTGEKTLAGMPYRDAMLTIKVIGTGDKISSVTVNNQRADSAFIPSSIKGNVDIVITMADNVIPAQPVNDVEQAWMPSTPIVDWVSETKGEVRNFTEGIAYNITVNGSLLDQITTPDITFVPQGVYSLMDIVPVQQEKWSGFTCAPYEYIPQGALTLIPASRLGATGTKFISDKAIASRFIETSLSLNTTLDFKVNADEAGDYFIDVRYANGMGPINTENKCALRSLTVNGSHAGAIVMPQRGIDEWLSTGFSNMLRVSLNKGSNSLSLKADIANMNGKDNTALIEYIRVIKK